MQTAGSATKSDQSHPTPQTVIKFKKIIKTVVIDPQPKRAPSASIRAKRSSRQESARSNSQATEPGELWRQVLRVLDGLPHAQSLKQKSAFSRTDLVSIVGACTKKQDELQQLVAYEQKKAQASIDQHADMLEKLKVAKLEKKLAEQKLLKLTELEDRVLAFEARLEAALAMLRKSMITNAFCLEFNKDLYDTIQRLTLDHDEKSQDFEQGVCFAVKTIKQLQAQHNIFNSQLRAGVGPNQVGLELNFDVRIDELETFVQETQEFIKRGHIEKKTIKIDLDAISSGEDSDSSSSGSRQNYIEIQDDRRSQPSGMDLESNSLQFGVEQSEWNQAAAKKL